MNDFYVFGDQGGVVRIVNFNEPKSKLEVIKKLKGIYTLNKKKRKWQLVL